MNTKGRLELFFNGKWGGTFVNGWNANNTRVACQELGFPDGEFTLVPRGQSMAWILEGRCTGDESSLLQCLKVVNVSKDHQKEIELQCKPGNQYNQYCTIIQ